LTFPTDKNVIVGMDRADDAGVYKINDELALIQTLDFFTPIVDDPYWFGQIAAANALSDIYAMGGVPKTAMNIVAFPIKQMDIGILRQILQGGIDKLKEAAVALIGGHSVEDPELKYGLSVTGFIHPREILIKSGLIPGDHLVLTKPLGTGIINTAVKGGLADPEVVEKVTRLMASLNRQAAEIMKRYTVHACTDITGFGLLGHMAEMASGSGCSILLKSSCVPILPEAMEYAAIGLVPGGAHKNRKFREPMVVMDPAIDDIMRDILYDPQTSGGLLICIKASDAASLISDLHKKQIVAADIGAILLDGSEKIRVVP
jgi:selenide,water dikinase